MIILVSDTSILIDLDRGGLIETAFSCGLTMVVPDLLYETELAQENGNYLKALGLGVINLNPREVEMAQSIHSKRPALSLPDCFALCCATRPEHTLVTGDKALRNEATSRLGTVRGLLWLLDQMEASGAVSNDHLYQGLIRITANVRCRLPKEEVSSRLEKWG
jgi:hypothetical protein